SGRAAISAPLATNDNSIAITATFALLVRPAMIARPGPGHDPRWTVRAAPSSATRYLVKDRRHSGPHRPGVEGPLDCCARPRSKTVAECGILEGFGDRVRQGVCIADR